MPFLVEFYGIPRSRTGVDQVSVLPQEDVASLSDILAAVATQFPRFAEDCMEGRQLRSQFMVSVDGNFFCSNADTTITTAETVLILSSDAGG